MHEKNLFPPSHDLVAETWSVWLSMGESAYVNQLMFHLSNIQEEHYLLSNSQSACESAEQTINHR